MKNYFKFIVVPLIIFMAQISLGSECDFGIPVFEQTFERTEGEPFTEHATFPSVNGKATIKLYSGGVEQNKKQMVTDTTIWVNGCMVFDEMEFNKQVAYLENQVDLFYENDIEVFLEGKPESKITILIIHEDLDAIRQFWHVVEELYKTSPPSATVLNEWFNNNVAEDFINDAGNRNDERDEWIDDPLPIGMTLCPVLESPMDVTGSPYSKGYQVSIEYTTTSESDSFLTYMVYNGTNWLWYGDRLWVVPEFESIMSKTLNPYIGYWTYKTGLAITLWDKNYLAYGLSVRSGIVTGPGLPTEGVKLNHKYPELYIRLYDYNPDNEFYYLLDDESILSIPDEAEYIFRLYAEDPAVVNLDDYPLYSFTEIIHKRPVLNSEINDSMFPTLVSPDTHYADEWGIGGIVEVEWINPDNMKVDWCHLGVYYEESPWWIFNMIDITPGDSTVTIDTTGGVWTNIVGISGHDEYGRIFSLGWLFWDTRP